MLDSGMGALDALSKRLNLGSEVDMRGLGLESWFARTIRLSPDGDSGSPIGFCRSRGPNLERPGCGEDPDAACRS